MPPPEVRPYEERDRDDVLAVLGDARAIDSPCNRLFVASHSPSAGVAVWVKPDAGEEGYLGAVETPAGGWKLFYQLVAAACEDAIAQGFRRGYFTVLDDKLLRRLERTFDIHPEACGWEPNTGRPVQWEVHVDLTDALRQLQAVI